MITSMAKIARREMKEWERTVKGRELLDVKSLFVMTIDILPPRVRSDSEKDSSERLKQQPEKSRSFSFTIWTLPRYKYKQIPGKERICVVHAFLKDFHCLPPSFQFQHLERKSLFFLFFSLRISSLNVQPRADRTWQLIVFYIRSTLQRPYRAAIFFWTTPNFYFNPPRNEILFWDERKRKSDSVVYYVYMKCGCWSDKLVSQYTPFHSLR